MMLFGFICIDIFFIGCVVDYMCLGLCSVIDKCLVSDVVKVDINGIVGDE